MIKKTPKKTLRTCPKRILNRPKRTIIEDLKKGKLSPKDFLEQGLQELLDTPLEDELYHKYDGTFTEVMDFIRGSYPGLDLRIYEQQYLSSSPRSHFDIYLESSPTQERISAIRNGTTH